ncbi:unnamed protein product [Arabidopsis halleri]
MVQICKNRLRWKNSYCCRNLRECPNLSCRVALKECMIDCFH